MPPAPPPPRPNGSSTNKLLAGILLSLLGVGGLQGFGTFAGGPDQEHFDTVEALDREAIDKLDDNGETLDDLERVIGATDSDGVPLVFVPRELVRQQAEVLETLKDIREELRDR